MGEVADTACGDILTDIACSIEARRAAAAGQRVTGDVNAADVNLPVIGRIAEYAKRPETLTSGKLGRCGALRGGRAGAGRGLLRGIGRRQAGI